MFAKLTRIGPLAKRPTTALNSWRKSGKRCAQLEFSRHFIARSTIACCAPSGDPGSGWKCGAVTAMRTALSTLSGC